MASLSFFKNYFNKFIYLFLLSFFHLNIVLAESELPKCKGEDYTKWKNCFGTYLNRDATKPDDIDKWTSDYTGEFGPVAGKREGKGSLIIYKNGKLDLRFVGELINDLPEGLGVISFQDGSEYVGEFKEGKRHGQGTHTLLSGDKYVGKYKDNLSHGLGVATYINGNEYVGEWKDGKKNGQGTFTWTNGAKYVGQWKDGKINGYGTYTYEDGQIYIGEWKDDEWNGQGSTVTADGRKYVGEWKDSKQNGQGTFTWTDGEKYVGQWKDGDRNGQGTSTYPNGDKYVGQWKDNKWHGHGTYTYSNGLEDVGEWKQGKLTSSKSKQKSLADTDIDLEKERKKLEEELQKLEKEKEKAKQAADKKNKITEQHNKFLYDAHDFEETRGIEFAQQFIKDLQAFVKENPKEFDILEITELMIDNKNALEGLWNNEHKKSFNSLFEYTMESKSFKEYYDNQFYERVEILVKEHKSEVKNVEDNIDFLKKYLQDNLTSKAAEKIVLHIRKTEKVFNDPTLENLKKVNKETNQFIKSLDNSKNKKNKKNETKNKSISEKKSTIKGSPKEKIINILKTLNFNYKDIEFSRNEEDFIIYNLDIDGQIIEKVEVEGLNKILIEGIFKTIVEEEDADYFNSYNGKYFDEIKISGIKDFIVGEVEFSGKEIGMTDLDFKKFDIIKKLINPPNRVTETEKNIISYMMSMSFDDFYFEDIIIKDDKETFKYDYVEISGFKELAINKFLVKSATINSSNEKISVDKILLEKLILDDTEILAFLNSDNFLIGYSYYPSELFSYIQNGMKSLRKFEINKFSLIADNKRFLDFNSFEFNNIKFNYLGDYGDKKIPISFQFNVDEADWNLKNTYEYRDIADNLKYDAIKFDFGGEWNWNTSRNNLSINLDLGITDAASIKLKSSFTGLSTDVVNLTGAPLLTYAMTEPKLKSLNLSLKDNSLKNRIINFAAEEEGMSPEQFKDFIAQSIKIFVTTFATNNILVENMQEAVTNFIYDSNNITLSVKPSQPLSITDLMPDFQEADANKIIDKLNLKISNNLF